MKYNSEIHRLITSLTEDILLLAQETIAYQRNYSDERSEIRRQIQENYEEKPNQNFIGLLKQGRQITKSVEMQFNSNFLYAFTLFEKFLGDLMKLSYKRSKHFRAKYRQRFMNFAKEEQKRGNEIFLNMFVGDKIIDNLDALPSPMRTLIDILEINKKMMPFEEHFLRYLEARERRNLLTHRGKLLDKRFFDSVRSSFGNQNQKTNKFLKENVFSLYSREFSEEFKQIDDLIGKSASISPRYFTQIVQTLVFLASAIHIKAFPLSKSVMKSNGGCYIDGSIHGVLCFSHKNEMPSFSFIGESVWKFFHDNTMKLKFSELGYIDQVNYCLMQKKHIDFMRGIYEKNPSKDPKASVPEHKKYVELLNCNNEKFEHHHELAFAYFEDDVKAFIKAANKLVNKEKTDNRSAMKELMSTWFIFMQWSHKPEVKAFLKPD